MDKIKRREFKGSSLLFFILCITGIGIPFAIIYLIESTIEIEYNIDDAEEFLEYHFKQKRR